MKISLLFEKYLYYLEVHGSNGNYQFAVSHCRCILFAFTELCFDRINKLKKDSAEKFVGYERSHNLSARTINIRLGVIRRCFKFNNLETSFSFFSDLRYKHHSFQVVPVDYLIPFFHLLL